MRGIPETGAALIEARPVTALDIATQLIKQWEGFRAYAYQDVGGVWTIGYGHTATAEEGQYVTETRAKEVLAEDLKPVFLALQALQKRIPVQLTVHQRGALASFAYNLGVGVLRDSPSVVGRLKSGDVEGAADGLLLYNKARVGGELKRIRGLANRRVAERDMFLTGIAEGENEASGATMVPEKPRSDKMRSTEIVGAVGGAGATTTLAVSIIDKIENWPLVLQLTVGGSLTACLMLFGYLGWRRWQKYSRAEIG